MSQISESGFDTSTGGTIPQLPQCPWVKWT